MYLYIHGFNSSPRSVKAHQLHAHLDAAGRGAEFACPALSHWPREAMQQLEVLIRGAQAEPIVLVGSSLGGYYATWLAEQHGCRAVLVNPAITPHLNLDAYLGPQKNLHTGEEYALTREHLRQLETYLVDSPTLPSRYLVVVTTGDEVLDYRDALARFPDAKHLVIEGSDHGFADFERYLDQVIAFGDASR